MDDAAGVVGVERGVPDRRVDADARRDNDLAPVDVQVEVLVDVDDGLLHWAQRGQAHGLQALGQVGGVGPPGRRPGLQAGQRGGRRLPVAVGGRDGQRADPGHQHHGQHGHDAEAAATLAAATGRLPRPCRLPAPSSLLGVHGQDGLTRGSSRA
jgi:hypothetical protein